MLFRHTPSFKFFSFINLANALCSFAVLTCESFAHAADGVKDIYDLTEVVAVQNRAYQFNQSFGLAGSYLPSDAFNREYSAGAFFNASFSEKLTWEVFRYSYCFNQPTQTKSDVQGQGFTVKAGNGGKLDYPVHIVTSGLVFTPLYFKGLMFNKRLIYGEMAFFAGLGTAIFDATGNRYLLTPGVQFRFFMSDRFAILAHLRNHFYSDTHQGVINMIDTGLALEIRTSFFEKAPTP